MHKELDRSHREEARITRLILATMILTIIAALGALASADFVISDPSNVINPADWTADNAILADYNITPTLYQTSPIEGAHVYTDQNASITRQYLTVDANDTSVLVISNGSTATVSYTEIVKFGHGSNLFQESFYGKLLRLLHAHALTDQDLMLLLILPISLQQAFKTSMLRCTTEQPTSSLMAGEPLSMWTMHSCIAPDLSRMVSMLQEMPPSAPITFATTQAAIELHHLVAITRQDMFMSPTQSLILMASDQPFVTL